MADPILFQSANRFLATSPSGDFGLYGAQPTFQTVVSTPDVGGADLPASPRSEPVAGPAAPVDQPLAQSLPAPEDAEGNGSAARATSLTPTSLFQPAVATDAGPDAPTTALNPFDLRPITLTSLEGQGDTGLAGTGQGGGAGAPTPAAADLPAQQETGPASALAAPVLAGVTPIAGDTVETVVGVVQPVVAGVQEVVGGTVNTVVGLTEPAVEAVGSAVDGAIGAVGDVAGDVTGLAGGTLDSLTGGTLDALTQTAGGAAETVVATVGEIGQVATDPGEDLPVTDLLGADPAGGIATLVNLVNVTEMLDLRDAVAPGGGDQTDLGDPVSGLLDTLTTDVSEITHPAEHGPDGTGDTLLPTHNPLGDLLGGNHDPGLGLGG